MRAVESEGAEKWVPAFAGTTIKRLNRLLRLAGLTLILLLTALPARAEDLAAIVAGLGGAGFADKEKAIVALGKLGDPRAVPVLQALGDDRLRKTSGGHIVIVTSL